MNADRVAFRVDASLEMGIGHVMRCLTLAEALGRRGKNVVFICRQLPGNLIAGIKKHGIEVVVLPEPQEPPSAGPPTHAAWAGVGWEHDAEETAITLRALQPAWLVVDHYAFDARWEARVWSNDSRLMVIDDLADRPHSAEILLDQNLGRARADYAQWVSNDCRLLVGPEFALLRPEFARLRQERLPKKKRASLLRLLISMGGVDRGNATGRVMERLSECGLSAELEIDILMGATAPWLGEVRARAEDMSCAARVHVDASDVARRMADADLAIGAAGATAWERCCLGLPSLVVALADNQLSIAEALQHEGVAVILQDLDDPIEFGRTWTLATDWNWRAEASSRAAGVTDGTGVESVVREMERNAPP